MPFPTPTAYLESMENIDKQIIEKAKNIDLVVFDVDGVLTDGGIYVSENGEESKWFFVISLIVSSFKISVPSAVLPVKSIWANSE